MCGTGRFYPRGRKRRMLGRTVIFFVYFGLSARVFKKVFPMSDTGIKNDFLVM